MSVFRDGGISNDEAFIRRPESSRPSAPWQAACNTARRGVGVSAGAVVGTALLGRFCVRGDVGGVSPVLVRRWCHVRAV